MVLIIQIYPKLHRQNRNKIAITFEMFSLLFVIKIVIIKNVMFRQR